MKTKAVIFDYDGVIVDSLELIHRVYLEIAKHFDYEHFKDFKGNIDFVDINWRNTLAKIGITDEKQIEKIKKIFFESWDKHKHLLKLVPGIKEVLDTLKKSYVLGVASNNWEKEIRASLQQFGILHYFDGIAGGEKEILKPDPTIILHCIKELGVKPKEAVYIGDMDGDIITGRRAGVKKVIAVTFGFHSHEKLKELNPDAIVHKPEELLEAVE